MVNDQQALKEMYVSVRESYDKIMVLERGQMGKAPSNQWKNIMRSMLNLMLSTDADDAFLEDPEKMAEYDQMLKKYLGTKGPSHSKVIVIPK